MPKNGDSLIFLDTWQPEADFSGYSHFSNETMEVGSKREDKMVPFHGGNLWTFDMHYS